MSRSSRKSAACLAARVTLPARPALRRDGPHLDFPLDVPPVLSDYLSYREDFRAEPFRIFHPDPRAIVEDDHAERRPHPILFLDEQEA